MLVFDDVEIDNAVNGILLSIFSASGQSCVAGSRLIVQETIYDVLIAKVAERASQIRIGDPLEAGSQMGPLATRDQLERIENAVAHAVEQGATLICGGKRPDGLGDGWYYEPTIIGCSGQALKVVREEMFGPVLSVLKFKDEAEAIRLANDTRFGLASGVFTRDSRSPGSRLTRRAKRPWSQ